MKLLKAWEKEEYQWMLSAAVVPKAVLENLLLT